MNLPALRRPLTYLLLALLLFGAGWYGRPLLCRHPEHAVRLVRSGTPRLTSPLLDVELPEGVDIRQEPIAVKAKVQAYIRQQRDAGRVAHVSVYVRDLLDGPWFGIDEEERFNPASMMKVPVMIAWLKRAERDPGVLRRQMTFSGKNDMVAVQAVRPRQTITAGRPYTVEELLHFMMSYSDNNAATLLYEALAEREIADVLGSMDVHNDVEAGVNTTSAHGFSGFFRILYNAAYLNREMSEKALRLLCQEDFPKGIAGGVPAGTIVAAKFGEFNQGPYGEDKQLHEFGIVYHPRGPYILGIMTRGRDAAVQTEVIRTISAMVYDAFSR